MWGWLKGAGKVLGGLAGIGGGADENKIAQSVADILGGAGAAFGGNSAQAANNRGAKFTGQLGLEQLLMDRDGQLFDQTLEREREGRIGRTDAWRGLLSAQRTLSPGARPQLSPYSVAPRQATGMEMDGANALSQELMQRLQGGNPIAMPTQRPMNIDPNLLNAGKMEKAGNWLSPIFNYLGNANRQKPEAR
jgi:hypothetical protein